MPLPLYMTSPEDFRNTIESDTLQGLHQDSLKALLSPKSSSAFQGSYADPSFRASPELPGMAWDALKALGGYFWHGFADPIQNTMAPLYGGPQPNPQDVLMATMTGIGGGWPGRGKGPNSIGQINAWHGSPHKFDKFSTGKIGTGEGAQAFGWGLYFTSEKEVAQYYAKQRPPRKLLVTEKEAINKITDVINSRRTKEGWETLETPESIKEWLEGFGFKNNPGGSIEIASRFDESLPSILDDILSPVPDQNVYSVTLHKGKEPGEYDYLKWDEPISKQPPALRKKLQESGAMKKAGYTLSAEISNNHGSSLYEALSKRLGSDKEASLFLLRAGIDGIEYPAGTLSGAASKAKNYVVFDEKAITIEKQRTRSH